MHGRIDPRLGDKVGFLSWANEMTSYCVNVQPWCIRGDRIEPFMSHRACIQTVLSSHLCVVNTVGNRIPDKVYECMRAGKWILALTDAGSDLENLMRHYSRGISVPAQDISAIRNALQNAWQGIDLKASERIEADPAVESYSSKHSAEMVARIFDSLLLSRGD